MESNRVVVDDCNVIVVAGDVVDLAEVARVEEEETRAAFIVTAAVPWVASRGYDRGWVARGWTRVAEAHSPFYGPFHDRRVEGGSISELHSLTELVCVVLPVKRDSAVSRGWNLRCKCRYQGCVRRCIY